MLFKSVRSTKQSNSLYGTKQNHTAPKNDDSIAHCHCQDYKRIMIFNEKKQNKKGATKKRLYYGLTKKTRPFRFGFGVNHR